MKTSKLLGALACVLASLGAGSAKAQSATEPTPTPSEPLAPPAVEAPAKIQLVPPAEPAPRKIDLTTPAPSRPAQRTYHMHDGFYLRGSVGLGRVGLTVDDGSTTNQDLKGAGLGLTFDLMAGGSPAPGIAIGGALLLEATGSAQLERGTRDEDRHASLVLVGPFIDGFPSPNRGLHFGGTLGLARLSVGSGASRAVRATGFGAAAWFGNDFWVGDDWSVGPLLRLSGAYAQRSDTPEVGASSLSLMLLVTALYH